MAILELGVEPANANDAAAVHGNVENGNDNDGDERCEHPNGGKMRPYHALKVLLGPLHVGDTSLCRSSVNLGSTLSNSRTTASAYRKDEIRNPIRTSSVKASITKLQTK